MAPEVKKNKYKGGDGGDKRHREYFQEHYVEIAKEFHFEAAHLLPKVLSRT